MFLGVASRESALESRFMSPDEDTDMKRKAKTFIQKVKANTGLIWNLSRSWPDVTTVRSELPERLCTAVIQEDSPSVPSLPLTVFLLVISRFQSVTFPIMRSVNKDSYMEKVKLLTEFFKLLYRKGHDCYSDTRSILCVRSMWFKYTVTRWLNYTV